MLPLETILERIRPATGGGKILEIEHDSDDGRVVYEIYFLDSSGRRREMEVEAATGRILKNELDD